MGYSEKFYAAFKHAKSPDAVMAYYGGQFSMIHINKNYFLDKPLMLISTWDGDEYSLQHAVNELKAYNE